MTHFKGELEKVREEHGVAKGKLQTVLEKMHQMYTWSCRVLRECAEKQIDIPFRSKNAEQYEVLTSRAYEVDEKTTEELGAAFSVIKVDFSCLPPGQLEKVQLDAHNADISEHRQSIEQEYEERLQELTKELETLNPNMCAPQQHQMEADKLEEIKQQGEEATANVAELEAKFEAC